MSRSSKSSREREDIVSRSHIPMRAIVIEALRRRSANRAQVSAHLDARARRQRSRNHRRRQQNRISRVNAEAGVASPVTVGGVLVVEGRKASTWSPYCAEQEPATVKSALLLFVFAQTLRPDRSRRVR